MCECALGYIQQKVNDNSITSYDQLNRCPGYSCIILCNAAVYSLVSDCRFPYPYVCRECQDVATPGPSHCEVWYSAPINGPVNSGFGFPCRVTIESNYFLLSHGSYDGEDAGCRLS